jgi:hypothetical protein
MPKGKKDEEDGKLKGSVLINWKHDHGSVANIEEAYGHFATDNGVSIDDYQKSFNNCLATICLHKDNPESVVGLHDQNYRWIWQYEKDFASDREARPFVRHIQQAIALDPDPQCILPPGCRWMLQLNNGKKWQDWVYIKQSVISEARLGVFSGRAFCKNTLVGYHIGASAWKARTEGGPYLDGLEKLGVEYNNYLITIRDNRGRVTILDPKPVVAEAEIPPAAAAKKAKVAGKKSKAVSKKRKSKSKEPDSSDEDEEEEDDGVALYMGMHYMNSAVLTYEKGSPEYERAKGLQNCRLQEDGGVLTTCKIYKNREMFVAYTPEQGKWKEHDKGNDKKPSSKKKKSEQDEGDEDKKPSSKKKSSGCV